MTDHVVVNASRRALKDATVTIVVPAYNSAQVIRDSLSSILNQTHRDLVVHIHDDGSSDDTIRAALAVADERCTLTVGPNRGPAAARNRIISAAKTPYVALMDSDDRSRPDRIARQVAHMEHNPSVDILSCGMQVIGELDTTYPVSRSEMHHERIIANLLQGSTLNTPPALGRRQAFVKYPMNTNYRAAEDYDMWCRMALGGVRFAIMPDILYEYRIHQSNTSLQVENQAPAATAAIKRSYHRAVLRGAGAHRFTEWMVWASEDHSPEVTDVGLMDSSLLMALGPGLNGVDSEVISRSELALVAREMAVRQYVRRGGLASASMLPLVLRTLGPRPAAVGLKRVLTHSPPPVRRRGNLAWVWPTPPAL